MKPVDPLFALVETFFCDHLQKVRGASPNTIAAYRDAVMLFLQFLAARRTVPVGRLRLVDLQANGVAAFLQHLEDKRHNCVATRNARRIALRAFFQHALRHDPIHASQYAQVLALPAKRCAVTTSRYLESHQMRHLLAQPDRSTPRGRRDYALLLFLYNTGARVSEAVAVHWSDLESTPPYQVRLLGKGRKERFCPLWPATLQSINLLLDHGESPTAGAVFRSARHPALTRHGAQYILTKYAKRAFAHDATFPKHVSPHVLRHSCACALLQAGVDLTVIRDYLGHASITSTTRYAKTNLKMKHEALANFWEQAGLSLPRSAPWRPTKSLLTFLSAL